MPAALLSREQVLDRLLETFRTHGYDGGSLADLSRATGLNKSSLYHHFPGGKEEMAVEVLAHLDRQLASVFAPAAAAASPAKRLDAMLDAIDAFYEGGRKACLLERLSASVDRRAFKRPLKRAFDVWIDAVEALCRDAGLAPALARARAEDCVVRIEGALVVCAGTGEISVFARTIRALRRTLLSAG